MNRTRYWWPTATTEQKLHQVKIAMAIENLIRVVVAQETAAGPK